MKVVLVQPSSLAVDNDRVEPPLGLLYIAAGIKEKFKRQVDVAILDFSGLNNQDEIELVLQDLPKAEMYGISSLCTNYENALKIVHYLREKNLSQYIALGGPNPSAMPEFTLENSKVDAVVVGEGEDVFASAVTSFMHGKKETGVIFGQGRDNIDTYPFPARHLIDMSTYSRRLFGKPVISILASRGCARRCIHCNSVIMGGGSKKVRFRSAKNVVDEIKSLLPKYGCYRFNDDNFTANPNLEEMLERLAELKISFRIFARIEDLTEKNSLLLKKAGCVHVSIGIESLNPDNLRFLGKRGQIGHEDKILFAKKHNLIVRAYFMVGLPFDTDETIYYYFKKASTLHIDEFSIYPLIPYPGTEIAKRAQEFGYTKIDSNFQHYIQIGKEQASCCALDHKNFSSLDVRRWIRVADSILQKGGAKHMRDSKIAT